MIKVEHTAHIQNISSLSILQNLCSFAGVSDIFKTPANSRRKSAFTKTNVCPATPLVGEMTEISVMNTPEESGKCCSFCF